MKSKICTKCGETFPLTVEYFNKAKRNKDGFRGNCKECGKQYHVSYGKRCREDIAQYKKQHYKDNKENFSQYYENNKNNEGNKERLRERNKQYYKDNKEKSKQYYEDNKKDILTKNKQYREDNLEKFRIYRQTYRTNKKQLTSTLTTEQWQNIKTKFNNNCAYCGKELPLAQEHFIPLSKGGEYTKQNIIPSCKSCNSSKSDSDFFAWYPKHKSYDKDRENFILKYIKQNNTEFIAI